MRTEMNVVYSFDDNYVQHAGLSIMSLLEHNQEVEYLNLYVIENNLSADNKLKLKKITDEYRRNIHYLNLSELTKNLKVNTDFNRSAYGRIFIADILNVDRVLYVDSDTIINNTLKPLLDVNMDGFLVAGVQDSVNPYYVYKIGLDNNHQYICDGGIIILNLSLWRVQNIVKKCIDFILKFNGNPPHNDQGTINYVCRGHIKILPPNYNVMPPMFCFSAEQIKTLFKMEKYYSQEEIDNAINHPIVIHYTDEFFNRPWFENCTHPMKNLYLSYLKKSEWNKDSLPFKKMSQNCKIQNMVYKYFPFWVYKVMVRFIEYRHMRK